MTGSRIGCVEEVVLVVSKKLGDLKPPKAVRNCMSLNDIELELDCQLHN